VGQHLVNADCSREAHHCVYDPASPSLCEERKRRGNLITPIKVNRLPRFARNDKSCRWPLQHHRVFAGIDPGTRKIHVRLIALFFFASVLFVQPVNSQPGKPDCDLPVERQLIDAVFNLDFDSARIILLDLDNDSLIPSALFYEALVNWIESANRRDTDLREIALADLLSSVSELNSRYSLRRNPESLLAWGLAAAQTSRILLFHQRIFSGYKMANQSIQNLQEYVRNELATDNGRSAAQMAIGLYFIYASTIPDEMEWIGKLVNLDGNLDMGRELIEQALQQSPQLSPEAGRLLLLEVPWSMPGACNYLNFSRELVQRYPGTPDFSIALQGLLLRCGSADRALEENLRYLSNNNRSAIAGLSEENYSELFEMGQLRGFADTGNSESLQRYSLENENLEPFRQISLANALDISGSRDEAVKIYESLSKNTSARLSMRKVAKMRLNIPYSVSRTIVPNRDLALAGCE